MTAPTSSLTFGAELRRARAVAWKDLTADRRSKANFNSVVFLAGLMLLLFGFALGPDPEALRSAASGVVWLTVIFSGVLAFNRSYQLELEGGALEVLLLYPGERWPIFVGKFAANLAFVFMVEVVIVPAAAVLYHLQILPVLPSLAAVLVLGTFGFVTLGTFYAAMASRVRAREVLLPLLLFPMLVPLLVASVEATTGLLTGDALHNTPAWVGLLAAFDVVFFSAALLAFEHIIEV